MMMTNNSDIAIFGFLLLELGFSLVYSDWRGGDFEGGFVING